MHPKRVPSRAGERRRAVAVVAHAHLALRQPPVLCKLRIHRLLRDGEE